MPDKDDFWDFYWEMRLGEMENLGKRAAILAASGLIRRLSCDAQQPVRLLELGCGEAQVLGALVDAHHQVSEISSSVGVDYNAQSLDRANRDYPGLRFVEGDFTDSALLGTLGKFEILLLVNALHEVFSAAYSDELGEVDVEVAKQRVEQALEVAVSNLTPSGWLVLFDGLEPPGDPFENLRIRFLNYQAWEDFIVFARQYQPFHISYHEVNGPLCIELPRRDFTRYITKSIFLGKSLWQKEKMESYQYFTEEEFRQVCARQGLKILELRTLIENDEKWRRKVELVTPGLEFPQEHILILAQSGSPRSE